MNQNYSPELWQAQKIMSSPELQQLQKIMSSPEIQQAQKIMSSPEYQMAQEILSSHSVQQMQKVVHVTSKTDVEVAKKIAEVSQKVFEKNRDAYRILANK